MDPLYTTSVTTTSSSNLSMPTLFILLALSIVIIAAEWKLFKKAGEHGWAAIVPFYNMYILFKITWGEGMMFLLMLIPFANIVIVIITYVKLAKVFGQGAGFALGLVFLTPIFVCIAGFSDNIQYVGIQK